MADTKRLKEVVKELKGASKMHLKQSKDVAKHIKMMENAPPFKMKSPMKKISGPCKAAAKRKFKVWPSAYASGWGVRCTKAGGPSKFGGGNKKK